VKQRLRAGQHQSELAILLHLLPIGLHLCQSQPSQFLGRRFETHGHVTQCPAKFTRQRVTHVRAIQLGALPAFQEPTQAMLEGP